MIVFAEGGTTNGQNLIKFKKGAFASLKPVKPLVVREWSLVGSATRGDVMGIWHWSFLIPFMCVFYTAEMLEMPVFEPNEYFWKKYWDGKNEEDKWKVYSEAVRKAMAKCGGFKLSESTQEDKMAYKAVLWGNKFKDD